MEMKTIGMIGGMSGESTVVYYDTINALVRKRLGGLHTARCALYSVDFGEIHELQHAGDWNTLERRMIDAGRAVQRAGADFAILCTNTMHKTADAVAAAIEIPLLHIADATALRISQHGVHRVGLLATRFTMEQDFYKSRMTSIHGLEVLVPDDDDRETVHRIIYDELCCGDARDTSRAALRAMIGKLVERGAQGIILGCTEIGLLIKPQDSPVPVFDTALIHAEAAVDFALS
jgi:aspartate racemase